MNRLNAEARGGRSNRAGAADRVAPPAAAAPAQEGALSVDEIVRQMNAEAGLGRD